MSYCRWSSKNSYCDVYVYADAFGGWTTHVAAMRYPPGAPLGGMERFFAAMNRGASAGDAWEDYFAGSEEFEAWRQHNPLSEIGHSEAGASFNHETPGECADNLERLRREGFVVPQYAIDELRAEQAEMAAESQSNP